MPWRKSAFILLTAGSLIHLQAWAFESVTTMADINRALSWGIQKQGQGYRTLLENNWQEGPQGSLLNIYSPFMQLALKGYKSNLPIEHPDEKDLAEVRKTCRRLISRTMDKAEKSTVRFVLSVTGNTPGFAAGSQATIEGYRNGVLTLVKPIDRVVPAKATAVSEQSKEFDAALIFTFKMSDLVGFDKFVLRVKTPNPTIRWDFPLRAADLR
ncbi:MAG: hypothetical protein VKK59_02080 [Vampirovibrionales bacterium]|nr:hypothetical protein [Vampirovibrionales bacterium]